MFNFIVNIVEIVLLVILIGFAIVGGTRWVTVRDYITGKATKAETAFRDKPGN